MYKNALLGENEIKLNHLQFKDYSYQIANAIRSIFKVEMKNVVLAFVANGF